MNKAFQLAGWILLVLTLVIGGLFVKTQLSMERARSVAAEQNAVQELARVRAEKTALETEIAALKAAAAAPSTTQVEVAPSASVTADAPEAVAAPAPPEAIAAPKAPAETAEESDRGERVANAQLGMMADMMYKSLFDDLKLDPELRASLRDVIAAHMQTIQQETVSAMQAKNEKAKVVHARIEALKSALRNELGQTLNAEQLAAWDEYEPVADQALYERLVDGQMNMLAPGLSNENRALASQVMAEELVRELDAFSQSDEIYSMDNQNGAQTRALNASLERLSGDLDEEQYGQVQGFVNQAIAMFDAMKEQ